jgi:hypothetical protein
MVSLARGWFTQGYAERALQARPHGSRKDGTWRGGNGLRGEGFELSDGREVVSDVGFAGGGDKRRRRGATF